MTMVLTDPGLPRQDKGFRSIARRLYSGQLSYDFIARTRRWYLISGVFLVVSLAALLLRGLNLGIDFKGGSTYELPRGTGSVAVAQDVLHRQGVADPVVQQLTSNGSTKLRIVTPVQSQAQVDGTITALSSRFGVKTDDVTSSTVGPTWGSEISRKAIQGLVIFLIAVVLYLTFRFEPRMALAAMLALIHDLLITVGIYVLVGFEVTPATVIAVLTILGFSLYDTVIVFDRVRELTQNMSAVGRITYAGAANNALNQTVMRSLNTSFIGVLPVASLLFVGAGLLGAGTLKDLALAQFVGILAGTYSSIFIATPLLVQFKEREPAVRAMNAKVVRAQSAGKAPTGRRPVSLGKGGPARGGVALLDEGGDPGEGGDTAEGDDGAGGGLAAAHRRVGAPAGVGAGAGPGARRVDPQRPGRRKAKGGRPTGKRRR